MPFARSVRAAQVWAAHLVTHPEESGLVADEMQARAYHGILSEKMWRGYMAEYGMTMKIHRKRPKVSRLHSWMRRRYHVWDKHGGGPYEDARTCLACGTKMETRNCGPAGGKRRYVVERDGTTYTVVMNRIPLCNPPAATPRMHSGKCIERRDGLTVEELIQEHKDRMKEREAERNDQDRTEGGITVEELLAKHGKGRREP